MLDLESNIRHDGPALGGHERDFIEYAYNRLTGTAKRRVTPWVSKIGKEANSPDFAQAFFWNQFTAHLRRLFEDSE